MQMKRLFLVLIMGFTAFLFSFTVQNQADEGKDEFIVVLDAGHGGHDPGNLGNGFLEKNIALNIVLKVGELLQQKDIKVVYTRKDDTFVDLYVRGEIANKSDADLFVSVHCDSHTSDAHGAGTFVLGLHANKQNFEIAKKENSAIYLEDNYETRYAEYDIDSPESIIGLTIMQEEFLDQSIMLAKMMQDNFTNRLKRNDRKVKQAGFIVLHQTFMPSVLVETGFLTNKAEGVYLNSNRGQAEMGKAIADAVIDYKDNISIPDAGVSTPAGPAVVILDKKDPPVEKAVATEIPEPEEITAGSAGVTGGVSPAAEPGNKDLALVHTDDKVVLPVENQPQTNKTASPAVVILTREAVEKADDTAADPGPDANTSSSPETAVQKVPEQTGVDLQKETVEPPAVNTPGPTPAEKPGIPGVTIEFRVQLLASSQDIALRPEQFKGLGKLSKEPVKNLFRYMYGSTASFKEAKLLESNAHMKGYATAYIVAYRNGKRIPVPQALKYVSE